MNRPKAAKVIMVQGTSSHAGKSVLATALCRIFTQEGLSVAPFKAQNMSLNSYATPDGCEIGRSQAVQASAAMVAPQVEMNPVLLKPEGDRRSQVVVLGRPRTVASAREYYQLKATLWETVTSSLDRLCTEYDVVVIEGAGSPAEINLKEHDIVNMRVARYAEAPVLLVGDIDRGGIFAQLIGTMVLLEPEERALVKGLLINKFRGDPSLLTSGLDLLREHTGVPVAGILPYFFDIHIPEEDSLGLPPSASDAEGAIVDIAVMRLPHIANFDDFDPLRQEAGVRVRFVATEGDFGDPDLIIIPGSKTTVLDLHWLHSQGLADRILAARRSGTPLIGVCAGYQMLGTTLFDPDSVESHEKETRGLGLLPTTTTFLKDKSTHQATGRVTEGGGLLESCPGDRFIAYEIHMGLTSVHGSANSPFLIESRSSQRTEAEEGAMDDDGLTLGTYLHGLFHNRAIRRSILERVAGLKGVILPTPSDGIEQNAEYDKLASFVRQHLDMDLVYQITGLQ